MDLQTLVTGNFDPVAAIRLLAARVQALEAGAKVAPPAQLDSGAADVPVDPQQEGAKSPPSSKTPRKAKAKAGA